MSTNRRRSSQTPYTARSRLHRGCTLQSLVDSSNGVVIAAESRTSKGTAGNGEFMGRDEVEDDTSRAATARYLADISGELSSMARRAGLEVVAHLLDMARVEAEENILAASEPISDRPN
jgi:hypothetical protein